MPFRIGTLMGFQGDLDTFGLAGIFQNLTDNQSSGTLHVYDNRSERYLVFTQGSIRTVSAGERVGVSLGEILVARECIDEAALATALTRQADSHRPLGEILVETGACAQQDIDNALRFQMEEDVYDLFTWHGAQFEFDESRKGNTLIGPDQRTSQVSVNTSGLILEAMRRIDEWQRLSEVVPSMELIPIIPQENQTAELIASLTPEEKRILTFIDGGNSIYIIARKSCMSKYLVTQLTARLFTEGSAREATEEEMRTTSESMVLQGDFESAIPIQKRILEISPEDLNTRKALAAALDTSGQTKEAARHYYRIAESLCTAQDFSGAAEACGQAHELDKENVEIMERLAILHTLADDLKEAASAWGRLIRHLEDSKQITAALEKAELARQDLPDDDTLQKTHARLLIAQNRRKEATAIYEELALKQQKRGDITNAISSYRNIIHIDNSRTDIKDRMNRLQMSASERRQRKTAVTVGIALGIVFVCVLVFLIINELRGNSAITAALSKSSQLKSEVEKSSDPDKKMELLSAAKKALTDAKPSFLIFKSSDEARIQELARIENSLIEAKQTLDASETERERVIKAWLRLKDKESEDRNLAFSKLKKLSTSTGTASVFVEQAKKLVAEYENLKTANDKERLLLLKAIKEQSNSADKRFGALKELWKKFPSTRKRPYPAGSQGLTVPVKIKAATEHDISLSASVIINKLPINKKTPCEVEIPCDSNIPVLIKAAGFKPQSIPFLKKGEPQRSLTVKLTRAARWLRKLRGDIEVPTIINSRGDTVFAASILGEVVAVNASNGSIRWPDPRKRSSLPEAAYRTAPILVKDRLFLLSQNGLVLALAADTGKVIWPSTGRGVLAEKTCLRMTGATLSIGGKSKASPYGHLLVTSDSDCPLFAIDAAKGELLWPTAGFARKRLLDEIGTPVGGAYHIQKEGHILVVNTGGELHHILEDGTPVGKKRLITGKLKLAPVFFRKADGELLLFLAPGEQELHCFKLKPSAPLKTEKLWSFSDFGESALSTTIAATDKHVIVGLASGRIMRLTPATGAITPGWDNKGLPGPVSSTSLLLPQSIIVPCAGRNRRPGTLVSIILKKNGFGARRWQLNLNGPPN